MRNHFSMHNISYMRDVRVESIPIKIGTQKIQLVSDEKKYP